MQLLAIGAGIAGWFLLAQSHFSSSAGWVLITIGFASVESGWLTAIVFGLREDQRWDAQFNPSMQKNKSTKSGWLTILTVIFSLILGAGVMMTFLAISFEQFFISQLQEAKKLSQ